jgi:hypothetical protein
LPPFLTWWSPGADGTAARSTTRSNRPASPGGWPSSSTHAAAAFLVLSANLTGILAGFAVRQIAAATSVRSFAIPALLPPLSIAAGWHARYDADPEHRWLRALIKDIARDLASAERPHTELPLRAETLAPVAAPPAPQHSRPQSEITRVSRSGDLHRTECR